MRKQVQSSFGPVQTQVIIPGSKSITNRALLLAALAAGTTKLSNILLSDDTLAFLEALQALGVMIQVDEVKKTCVVYGVNGIFPATEAKIWCQDAGTAARFLLAAVAASPGGYTFDATERLRHRPISALLKVLHQQGAKFTPADAVQFPLTIHGTEDLRGGEIFIDASQTGQFVSALLMMAPLTKHAVTIESHATVGEPYIEMTCQMMAEFGVLVKHLHHGKFLIPTPQRYQAQSHYNIEPDLSTASYFFAAAAVTGGEVTIPGIDRARIKQGDVAFVDVLAEMGCEVITNKNDITVRGQPALQGVTVNMHHFSDTFMTLAAVAPFAASPTTITNIGHTRHQESDRIAAMCEALTQLSVKVEAGEDWIKIYPSKPRAGIVNSHNDHRIAMASAVIGLVVPGVEIEGAECVAKTCPEFFTLWEQLLETEEENICK